MRSLFVPFILISAASAGAATLYPPAAGPAEHLGWECHLTDAGFVVSKAVRSTRFGPGIAASGVLAADGETPRFVWRYRFSNDLSYVELAGVPSVKRGKMAIEPAAMELRLLADGKLLANETIVPSQSKRFGYGLPKIYQQKFAQATNLSASYPPKNLVAEFTDANGKLLQSWTLPMEGYAPAYYAASRARKEKKDLKPATPAPCHDGGAVAKKPGDL